ncbi:MAG: hypothetical protein BWY50_01010 [Spirochaetes bacterium ADurb.Bin315]|nr:MAG: hypothetical protein BWY50_01010 [Spirochaetes bacterium ADurb.Bin315]
MDHRGNAETGVFNKVALNLVDHLHLLLRIIGDCSIGTGELSDAELQSGFHGIRQVIIRRNRFADGDGLLVMNLKPDRYQLGDFFLEMHFFQ